MYVLKGNESLNLANDRYLRGTHDQLVLHAIQFSPSKFAFARRGLSHVTRERAAVNIECVEFSLTAGIE